MSKNLKIAILCGGVGAEREISLLTGETIYQAVLKAGYDVVRSDITPTDVGILEDESIDVYFLGLHGKFGEDGTLQKILEDRGLVFTGSGSTASKAAFDKHSSKEIWKNDGISVAPDVCVSGEHNVGTLADELVKIGEKFVIKPITQGSSVGVDIVTGPKEAAEKAIKCFGQYGDCMVEKFIAGTEVTVGIVLEKVLPIIEVRPKTTFYDYNAKYFDDATEYLFGTITDGDLIEKINDMAMKCYESLGCRHISRVDLIVDENKTPFVLEINTLPGFTSHSLVPMAAVRAGMEVSAVCSDIIQAAVMDSKKDV